MKEIKIAFLLTILLTLFSCKKQETASDILQKTIQSIDTIETIYFKQDMARTNPQNTDKTIHRYREMYFKRLISDSIVGVKGHWYMYVNDKENVIYEDIYDGNKLIRKNNRDSAALVYDLVKYPEFKEKPFWGHNTLYGIQYELKYMLINTDSYSIERLADTIIENNPCYQIEIILKDQMTMPGFAAKLEENKGNISKTLYFIDKQTNYPVKMRGETYSREDPNNIFFIDQRYYDIKFNLKFTEDQFRTSSEIIKGFKVTVEKPNGPDGSP